MPTPPVDYRVRYTCAYLQPTVHLQEDRHTWGFGLRASQAYCHRFTQMGADTLGGVVNTQDNRGTQVALLQSVFQHGYRVSPLVSLSTTFGAQALLHDQRPFINLSSAAIGQLGVHLTLQE